VSPFWEGGVLPGSTGVRSVLRVKGGGGQDKGFREGQKWCHHAAAGVQLNS